MSILKLTRSGPPLTARDMDALQDELGARLPAAYRRFLLQHNGGYVKWPYTSTQGFYSVGGKKSEDLLTNRRRMQRWLPVEVIPIAYDVYGNEICLAIKGKNRGKVYLWDHEGAPAGEDMEALFPELFADLEDDDEEEDEIITWPGEPDLTLIADSFPEFLEDMEEDAKEFEAEVAKAEAAEAAKANTAKAKAKSGKPKAKPARGKAKPARVKAEGRSKPARATSVKAKPARGKAKSAKAGSPARSSTRQRAGARTRGQGSKTRDSGKL